MFWANPNKEKTIGPELISFVFETKEMIRILLVCVL